MIRVVSLKKAVAAGVAGAVAMEIFSLAGRAAGFATVDLVSELASVDFPNSAVLANLIAVVAHVSIGVCWAVFYAFFFWGRFRLRPPLQGLLFALIPAALAILFVYPELALMKSNADSVALDVGTYFGRYRCLLSRAYSSVMLCSG